MARYWLENTLDGCRSGCSGCLNLISILFFIAIFFTLIMWCSSGYLDYNYNNRIVITKQATMTYFLFQPTQNSLLDIGEKDIVHFLNQTAKPVLVCIGTEGDCTPFNDNATGPRELYAPGRKIQPGQLVDVTFEHAGSYVLTVSTLPHTRFMVNVIHPSSD